MYKYAFIYINKYIYKLCISAVKQLVRNFPKAPT